MVGAGIAGLALSNVLSRRGVAVTVAERNETLKPRGLGLALLPNAMKALDQAGLGDAVRRNGVAFDRAVPSTAGGEPIFELPFPRTADGGALLVGIHRNALVEAFLGGNDADIRLGMPVSGLREFRDDVEVRFGDGSSERYDLVVAADGLHSTIRSIVSPGIAPINRSYVAWRAVVDLVNDDPLESVLRTGHEAFFGTFPVSSRHLYLFALQHTHPDKAIDPGLGGLRKVAARFEPFCSALADRVTPRDLIFVPVAEVITDQWVRRRVVLIGDAAHAIVPFNAQGAAMAIEDAVTLAETLVTPTDLARWAERRQQRVEVVRATCRTNGIAASLEGSDAAAALDPETAAEAIGAMAEIYSWPHPTA